jgi:hypothetical protein
MFIGHFALGFAAKRAAPGVSLAVLFAAAQLADLLWPVLLMAGLEQVAIAPGITRVTPLDFISYPYSHSLLLLAVWGVLLALVVRARSAAAFGLVAGLVVSHWVLDFVTHRPDMPIYPGSAKYGLGLWNSLAGTLAAEIMLFAAGVWAYASTTRPRDRVGRWAFAALVAFLTVVYVANIIGPPPPSIPAIAIAGIVGGAILLMWAWWVDAHRQSRARNLELRS